MTDGPDFPTGPDAELPLTGPDAELPHADPDAEFPLAGLDAERPLPAELRARLEAALLAALADGLPVPADAESLDAPRPLPEALRTRLESALLAEAAATPTATTPASEAPVVPPAAAAAAAGASSAIDRAQGPYRASGAIDRAQATGDIPGGGDVVPLESRRRKVAAWWSAVAAVVVLLLAVAGLAGIDGGSGKVEVANAPTTTTAETPASLPSDAGAPVEAPSPTAAPAPSPASTGTTRSKPVKPSPTTTGPLAPRSGPPENTGTTNPEAPTSALPGGGSQPAPSESGRGPAPPFYDSTGGSGDAASPPAMSSDPSASSPGGSQGAAPNQPQKSGSPAAAPAGSALRVGVIPGDADQEAGFGAYINRLNQNGGVAGHRIELVTVGPNSRADNTIATVNLSAQPVAGPGGAPSWANGPLLETLTATENLLPANGAVFSFASAPERQGHLAADALFPSDVQTAVIYAAASGPLHDVVPAAMRAVLEERGVKVKVIEYDVARQKTTLEDADAALLSLDPANAKAWVAAAKSANYRPPAGVAGIYSLFDEELLADLPEGARVVSPYVVPGGTEGQAIRSEGGGTSASVLHGWATAKSLAAAIWRTDADSPAEVQAALEGLTDWSSGLTPPYETRAGTRSRTPEGVLFQVQSGAFNPQGGFRTDPRSQPV